LIAFVIFSNILQAALITIFYTRSDNCKIRKKYFLYEKAIQKMLMKLILFHHHFMSSFFADILLPKNYKAMM